MNIFGNTSLDIKTMIIMVNNSNITMNSSLLNQSFPHRSRTAKITLSFFMAIIITLSVVGNILLLSVFIRSQRLRSSFANRLIMSLAMADFLTAAFPLTYQLATVIDIQLISNSGLLCKIGGLAAYALFYVSVLTMVMLSVDRFIALGFPLQYTVRMTFKVRTSMLAYPWIHSALFYLFCFLYADVEFEWESMACGFTWDKIPVGFTMYLLLVHVTIPFTLLFVLCSWTVRLVRAQNKEILLRTRISPTKEHRSDRQTRIRDSRRASEIKLAKISIAIVFIFLFSWSPFVVTRACIAFAGMKFSTDTLAAAALAVYISLFSNPIIYSSLRADLRRQMFCCIKEPGNFTSSSRWKDRAQKSISPLPEETNDCQ